MNTVMIATGESSGELYGSLLARALKIKCPDLHIIGIGGEKMRDAGVELISGISSSFGALEAVASFKALRETFSMAVSAIERSSPKVVVLIDYPEFNIRLARIAKKKGAKTIYYVSPQVWAWRKGRVKTIAEVSDRIAVILPFEEPIYKYTGVPCEFVGHPILEEIEFLKQEKVSLKTKLGLDAGRPVLALLPGSRPHELKRLLPVMLDVTKEFKTAFPENNYQFIMPIAPNIDINRYQHYIDMLKYEGIIIKKENAVAVLSVSDIAVIASGTATLQAAFVETPMVVIYKLSPISYLLGKLIVNVKHISLINLISGREVVKELLQSRADAKNIVSELRKIMLDNNYRNNMIRHFREAKEIFAGRSPSMKVADMICEMAGCLTQLQQKTT